MPGTTLPHTGLTVPPSHPDVTALKTVNLPCGQAFEAETWWDGQHVGWFENPGTGGATTFRTAASSHAVAKAATVRMAAFVAACAHPWLPVSASMVYTLLVEEHDHAGLVRDAVGNGGTAARYLVGGLPIGVFAEVGRPPEHWADLASDLDLLRGLEPDTGFTGTWQVWDGERWRDLAMAA